MKRYGSVIPNQEEIELQINRSAKEVAAYYKNPVRWSGRNLRNLQEMAKKVVKQTAMTTFIPFTLI
ncbi:hypothetical protein KKC1_16260 [Calderihabitans maritimus]|uniref:Uncharacterized protein n=1 Tax=Calderihabitans maritimus TaxID=1246530 RepID=A0A1Z5HSH6_9FIRM|nr:hypothetical protein KKC1_16260 [Calderihabitans maritimus]